MYYTIYKITNIINGKIYIGKHQTENLDDGYFGSGKVLRRAIKKHGTENFIKEYIEIFNEEWKMNLAEKILVVIDPEISYNLCSGGKGGFSYINSNFWTKEKRLIHNNKVSGFKKISNNDRKIYTSMGGHASWVNNTRKPNNGKNNPMFGKKHTEETKIKISLAMKTLQKGEKNSQYGTCWINNNIENKKIKKENIKEWEQLGYKLGKKK